MHETWRESGHVDVRQVPDAGHRLLHRLSDALARWPEIDPARVWLATTDADSCVPPDWLTVQLQAHGFGADLWAGRIRVAEKGATVQRWLQGYSTERGPIHGASLGFTAAMYTDLGGFRGLRSGEDRDLQHRAMAAGFRISHDSKAVVTTSSRRRGRAPEGFADVLNIIEEQDLEATSTGRECIGSLLAG